MRHRPALSAAVAVLLGWSLAAPAAATAPDTAPAGDDSSIAQPVGTTRMVSVANNGDQLNRVSTFPSVSADGRYVAFTSRGRVVEGRLSPYDQVYVRDQRTGVSVLVSATRRGGPGNGPSGTQSISADGSLIAYASSASDLVRHDDNGVPDVFLYDTATGKTSLLSRSSSGGQTTEQSNSPSISADGTHVGFGSSDPTIVNGSGGFPNVFLHDIAAGTTELVSRTMSGNEATGPSYNPSLSADGRLVTYRSAEKDLVADDDNGVDDVFLYDAETATTVLITRTPDGEPANISSGISVISADGSRVTYSSRATDLLPEDTNIYTDVYCYDVATGVTTLISAGRNGRQSNGDSYVNTISGDGAVVAYVSYASNIVRNDDYPGNDVLVHDLGDGSTTLITRAPDGSAADGMSFSADVSDDGTHVAFDSAANNLVPGDVDGEVRRVDVFLHRLG